MESFARCHMQKPPSDSYVYNFQNFHAMHSQEFFENETILTTVMKHSAQTNKY